jgi:RNA methyltransferase, TrmH family
VRILPPLSAAQIAQIRELLQEKKAREKEEAFVLEGIKPLRPLLEERSTLLVKVVVTQTFLDHQSDASQKEFFHGSLPVYLCLDRQFKKMSDVETTQGILAVVRKPQWDQASLFKKPELLGIYGEEIQDPANIGGIIRSAAAFGLDALWLSPGSADPFNPKVVRGTAGTLLTFPVFTVPDSTRLIEEGCALLAAEPPGPTSKDLRTFTTRPVRSVLAFGNESRGLSPATQSQAALRFHIPLSKRVESLNVAASAAVAAFYFKGLPTQPGGKGREARGEG